MIDAAPRDADDAAMPREWEVLAVYPDPVSAAGVVGLLRSEGLEARIAADEPVPGLMKSYTVEVRGALLPRAQGVLGQAQLSEEEWSRVIEDERAKGDSSGD